MSLSIQQVQQHYLSLFGRPADPKGLAYFTDLLAHQPDGLARMTQVFVESAEFKASIAGKSTGAIVDMLYQNMFGHSADAAGRAFWVGHLEHGMHAGALASLLATSAQGSDKLAYDSKLAAAIAFTGSLDSDLEMHSYQGRKAMETAVKYLAFVHDAPTLAAVTTPYALKVLSDSLLQGWDWTQPMHIEYRLQNVYTAMLGRPADKEGLAYWSAGYDGDPMGERLQQLAEVIGATAEFKGLFAQPTSYGKVAAIYSQMFGRGASFDELAYWSYQLDNAKVDLVNLILVLEKGVSGADMIAFLSKAQVSAAFTARLDEPSEWLAYSTPRGMHLVSEYIAGVHDIATATAATKPEALQALIDSMSAPLPPTVPIITIPIVIIDPPFLVDDAVLVASAQPIDPPLVVELVGVPSIGIDGGLS